MEGGRKRGADGREEVVGGALVGAGELDVGCVGVWFGVGFIDLDLGVS